MRFVVASRLGRRGEGLGNEMIPWAKGWIASKVLGAQLVGPSWGLNRRGYYRNFRTSRLDFVGECLLLSLPHYRFTEEEYRATGQVDFGSAIEIWAKRQGLAGKNFFTVSVGGMYGGYPAIWSARSFLLSQLLTSRDALRNVYEATSQLDRRKLFVAVHMRCGGDFSVTKTGESVRGKFNISVPGEWYLWVCEALRKQFGERVEFRFFTDAGGAEFDEAVRRFNPGQRRQPGLTVCSDLLLMAQADVRVCSVSSYSLMANFLSMGPYIWYEPQLTLADGVYSLWGHEGPQKEDNSLTSRGTEHVSKLGGDVKALGAVMNIGDPLPETFVDLLETTLSYRDSRTNLIEYGCLPAFRQQSCS